MEIIDCSKNPTNGNVVKKYRPWGKLDNGHAIIINDLEILNAKDATALAVDFAYKYSNDEPEAVFKSVSITNYHCKGARRTQEGHMDDLNVRGSWDRTRPAILKLSHIVIEDSKTGSPAIFLNDGFWDTIELDNIIIKSDVEHPYVMVDMKGPVGLTHVNRIKITNSPRLRLILQGAATSIDIVEALEDTIIETPASPNTVGQPKPKIIISEARQRYIQYVQWLQSKPAYPTPKTANDFKSVNSLLDAWGKRIPK